MTGALEQRFSRYFSSTFLSDWEPDREQHFAEVVQRLRAPRRSDAELLGLRRIEELSEPKTPPPPQPQSAGAGAGEGSGEGGAAAEEGFVEGRGAYIKEYLHLVIMPVVARAQSRFRPHSRSVGRTPSDVTYVVERPREADRPPPRAQRVLDLHAQLYDALVDESAAAPRGLRVCVDFVLVHGKMLYHVVPEFLGALLIAYQFPFGVVLLHKASYPKVLVVLTYSQRRRGRRALGGRGVATPRRRDAGDDSSSDSESESDSESVAVTSWYSKPWLHPANCSLRAEGVQGAEGDCDDEEPASHASLASSAGRTSAADLPSRWRSPASR